MALTLTQQIRAQVERASHVLIAFKKQPTLDDVATAAALRLWLQGINKPVDVVCDGFTVPNQLAWLEGVDTFKPRLENLQKFIISLDTSGTEVDSFSYSAEGDKLNIYVTPKAGSFTDKHVKMKNADYRYDLIFTVGTPDLASLGKVFEDSTEFFHQVPIINIDFNPNNESYGQINAVEVNAVASSEIVYQLLKVTNGDNGKDLKPNLTTSLLTGMIAATESFRQANVTPHALAAAGELMEHGADREAIVAKLYKNRSLATLNLWGRVLSRLHTELDGKLIWAQLAANDFIESQSAAEDLPAVVDELISSVPGIKVVVLIYQTADGKLKAILRTLKGDNALYLSRSFTPLGDKSLASFKIEGNDLAMAAEAVVASVKRNMANGKK
ncbi:hypothetical protein CL622_04780 [archaeon]|nr:hypothetical protein [archaeon]